VRLADLAETSLRVAATRSRLAKVDAIAARLGAAAPDEVAVAVRYLTGELRQRRAGVGWAALRRLPPAAATASLSALDVDLVFGRLESAGGPGAVAERRAQLRALLARATVEEQRFLVSLALGELRQGAQAGIMAEAVARAAGVEVALVRRAAMLSGDLATVADAALRGGAGGLDRFQLVVGRPVRPMLAQTAASVAAAMGAVGTAIVEWKLDGVRVQVHRDGDDVAVFTRTLDPITSRVPELVEAARALAARSVVLDGEAIALRPDGRPRPFQETSGRVASRDAAAEPRRAVPLTLFVFDCLWLEGEALIDRPAAARLAAAAAVLPPSVWVPRVITGDVAAATRFFEDAVARGHEGVMVKALTAPYQAGRRGAAWLKVKPRHTLDLVVLAAEWGHGRRQGWLSTLHLGARDPATGGFAMLGKTFKGLTDVMLAWQTARLLALATDRGQGVVAVRPELVVEVAFDGIQSSPRYPAGMALRFARVVRHRPDRRADEADTVATVRRLHRGG